MAVAVAVAVTEAAAAQVELRPGAPYDGAPDGPDPAAEDDPGRGGGPERRESLEAGAGAPGKVPQPWDARAEDEAVDLDD